LQSAPKEVAGGTSYLRSRHEARN